MTERKLFGTDGIRGVANKYPMTPEISVRLGQAIAHHFKQDNRLKRAPGHHPRILIGKDTRLSGYMFESALAAGITSMGADVQLVGPLPTPAISFLTTSMRADAGIVISASHNGFQDNGIKIFGADGFKLPDAEEALLEQMVLSDSLKGVESGDIGKAMRIDDAGGRYIVFLKNTFPKELSLEGVRVVIDCAHGAAYRVAPDVLRELGADVFTLGNEPNGTNINFKCGSTYPEATIQRVRETRADIGICLDGDADRVILVDENGEVVDGDTILALAAMTMAQQGKLAKNTLVATIMSNIGLEIALKKRDIAMVRTAVGDRYVVEKMREDGFNLGGEQSGHLIFSDHTTTGDGMLAALQVLAILQREQRPLSEFRKLITPYPQVLVNVKVREMPDLAELTDFQNHLAAIEEKLGDEGRVIVRYSGTEPKARVMVEGPELKLVEAYAEELAGYLRREIGV
ncbi:phosphoglucosamine mutase [Bradymonas sediminis]|uniref:Phosphoglucosamine mutase n=1 Tax=Bradymonas sediminis TaxID=1548548 RepID=A0A2Z4FLC4_9DELT|nr:phosphoglucosamine mutase [Bradymonas sediminis]AWV89494.1 phosphoglucosamine mutase [Bradymonas sediminis]TDP76778.1 phosphoglucosamine mutase [Bradymonas sediminis]